MSLFTSIFHHLLYRPLFNALVILYQILPGHDLGVVIIVLTILIRLALYPLSQKALKSQKILQKLQPKIKEIQKKYPAKEDQVREMMALYKKYQISPLAGFLPILIQIPIIIALYKVFLNGLKPSLDGLYGFVPPIESLNPVFLGVIDLSQKSLVLALLAGFFQFLHSKISSQNFPSSKKGDFSSIMNQQMVYLMPFLTVFIAWSLPAALALYWAVMTLIGLVQEYHFRKKKIEIGL